MSILIEFDLIIGNKFVVQLISQLVIQQLQLVIVLIQKVLVVKLELARTLQDWRFQLELIPLLGECHIQQHQILELLVVLGRTIGRGTRVILVVEQPIIVVAIIQQLIVIILKQLIVIVVVPTIVIVFTITEILAIVVEQFIAINLKLLVVVEQTIIEPIAIIG